MHYESLPSLLYCGLTSHKFPYVVEPQVQHRSLHKNLPLLLTLTKMNLVPII